MDNAREESGLNVTLGQSSNNGQSISGSGRKRGHQHHIRHSGTRSSNVKADEVIAALRRGDQLPVNQTIQDIEPKLANFQKNNLNLTDDSKQLICDSSDTVQCNEMNDQNANQNRNIDSDTRNVTLIEDLNKNHHRLDSTSINANILISSTNEQHKKTNVISKDSDDLVETAMVSKAIGALNSDIDMESSLRDDLTDSISSGSSSGSKTKLKKSKNSLTSELVYGAKKEKRNKKAKRRPPNEERPPLEGADADQWAENDSTVDVENDPEAAEWSKLRCTSERTEVVAEREYRRQNRRCADYPGLAFGRSIFSSDTMMKLNIIRNELHNIMKTQLKRVCVTRGDNNVEITMHIKLKLFNHLNAFLFQITFHFSIRNFVGEMNFFSFE